MARFPQAALLLRICAHASAHGLRPSDVYEDFLQHPADYRLVWAFETWKARREEEEREAAQRGGPRSRR